MNKTTRILLTGLLCFLGMTAIAQETPPTGLKAINAQFYIHLPDSTIWQNKGTPYNWNKWYTAKQIERLFPTKAALMLTKDSLVNLYTSQNIGGNKIATGMWIFKNNQAIYTQGTTGGLSIKDTITNATAYFNPYSIGLPSFSITQFSPTYQRITYNGTLDIRNNVTDKNINITDEVITRTSDGKKVLWEGDAITSTDTTSLARKIGNADMVQKSYSLPYLSSVTTPPTGYGKISLNLNGSLVINKANGYTRTWASTYPGATTFYPAYKSVTHAADSTDVANVFSRKDVTQQKIDSLGYTTNSQTIYNNAYFNNTADFSVTATTVVSSGSLKISGGDGTINKYLNLNGFTSNDVYQDIELSFTIDTLGAGVAPGRRGGHFAYAQYNTSTNTMSIVGDEGTMLSLPSGITVAVGDACILTYSQRYNVIAITFDDRTQNKKIAYAYNVSLLGGTVNYALPNTTDPAIYQFGGSVTITKLSVFSNIIKYSNVSVIGDSKTLSTQAGATFAFINQLKNIGTTNIFAGGGNTTSSIVASLPYFISNVHSKYALIEIGCNDIRTSISPTVWQANLTTIHDNLVSSGITPIFLKAIPELILDQTALNTFLDAQTTWLKIDPSIGFNTATMLASDGVHPNILGNKLVAKNILASALLPTSSQIQQPSLNNLTTINTFGGGVTYNSGRVTNDLITATPGSKVVTGGSFAGDNISITSQSSAIKVNKTTIKIGAFNDAVFNEATGQFTFGQSAFNIPAVRFVGGTSGNAITRWIRPTTNTGYEVQLTTGFNLRDTVTNNIPFSTYDDVTTENQIFAGARAKTTTDTRKSVVAGTTFSGLTNQAGNETIIVGQLGTGTGASGPIGIYGGIPQASGTTAHSRGLIGTWLYGTGLTMNTGQKITTALSNTSNASLNISPGTPPTTPVSGDVWAIGGGELQYRHGASTVTIADLSTAQALSNKVISNLNTFQAATGTTADSLRFASSGKMVEKAIVNGNNITATQTATTITFASAIQTLRLTGSGTGAATTISIAHGLTGVTSASIVTVQAINAASQGIQYVTADATNINITYSAAPVTGTNNLSYNVFIKP